MPVTFDLDSTPGVAIGIGSGDLSIDESMAAAEDMWRLAQVRYSRMLWDLRDARFRFDVAHVHQLGRFARRLAGPQQTWVAFVVSTDLHYGLVRVFEAIRETEGVRTQVFRDKIAAIEWLNGDGA